MSRASKIGITLLAATFVASCASHRGFSADNPFESAKKIDLADWANSYGFKGFKLVFSGNVNGEIDPCGCAVNPKGGLDRRLNYLREHILTTEQQASTLVVDAGNALFPTWTLDSKQGEFQKKRAALILKSYALMKVAAQNVGRLDLSAGQDFLKNEATKAGVPLISTNWIGGDGKPAFAVRKDIAVPGGLKFTILGLSTSGEAPVVEGLHVRDALEALKEELSKTPADNAVVILSDLGGARDKELALKLDRAAIFVGSRDLSSLEIPIHQGQSLIVQGQLQGQQWGVLDVAWNPSTHGWYNSVLGEKFKQRWQDLAHDQKEKSALPNSPDKQEELDRLASIAADMSHYAPEALDRKSVYEYQLVDMTVQYAKKNEITDAIAQLKKDQAKNEQAKPAKKTAKKAAESEE